MHNLAKDAAALVGATLLLALIFLAFTTAAEARRHHVASNHHHKHGHVRIAKTGHHRTAPRNAPTSSFAPFGFTGSLVSRMERDLGTNPTGWARAWCGQYLGLVARALGLKPPSGFPLATAWARFGVPAAPAPGVVAVMNHHVGVVRRVLDGNRVELISGNHGHRVGIGVYPTRIVIAWRAPG